MEEFINNKDNLNKDWSYLFRNNIAKKSYLNFDKINKPDDFLKIIYEQIKNNEFIDDIYNDDYQIFKKNINELKNKENIYTESTLFNKVKLVLNDEEVNYHFIYSLLRVNLDDNFAENYVDFLKKNLFNSVLFQQKDVDEKSEKFLNEIKKN